MMIEDKDRGRTYFLKRDGTFYTDYTKEEIYEAINNSSPKTFIKFLKAMDYPWVRDRWELYCRTYGFCSKILGRYIAWCRLKTCRIYGYADSALFYTHRIELKEKYDDCILC